MQLTACRIQAERINTPGRCSVYFILYRFISSSMCAYRQSSFFIHPFTATQTMSHGSYTCGCMCRSAQCPADTRLVTPNLCSSLIAFFSLIVPLLNAEKNRYPLINSKAVKILSSPKGHVSSVEVSNQSLPWWNEKVEPSGRKSWLVASCNKNVSLLRRIRGERLHNANDMFPWKERTWYVHTHNLVRIAYHCLLW